MNKNTKNKDENPINEVINKLLNKQAQTCPRAKFILDKNKMNKLKDEK